MTSTQLDIIQYCEVMEEVKVRIAVVQSMLVGGATLGLKKIDEEIIVLNFRKVLELIAFGSVVANKQKYSAAYSDFHKHWNARRMLSALELVNSDFYPVPLIPPVVQPDGSKHLDLLKDGFITKDEFIELYNYCGDVLHAQNPFAALQPGSSPRYTLKEWLSRIQELLSIHRAKLVDAQEGWLVIMHDSSNGKVHALPFEAIRVHRIPNEP